MKVFAQLKPYKWIWFSIGCFLVLMAPLIMPLFFGTTIKDVIEALNYLDKDASETLIVELIVAGTSTCLFIIFRFVRIRGYYKNTRVYYTDKEFHITIYRFEDLAINEKLNEIIVYQKRQNLWVETIEHEQLICFKHIKNLDEFVQGIHNQQKILNTNLPKNQL